MMCLSNLYVWTVNVYTFFKLFILYCSCLASTWHLIVVNWFHLCSFFLLNCVVIEIKILRIPFVTEYPYIKESRFSLEMRRLNMYYDTYGPSKVYSTLEFE